MNILLSNYSSVFVFLILESCYNKNMKNNQSGFIMNLIIALVALAFINFYKTNDGRTYYEKIQDEYKIRKIQVENKIEDLKKKFEEKDKETNKNLE